MINYEKVIEKRIRSGLGQGEGLNYRAWISPIRSKSIGLTNQWRGLTIDRPYTLLSELEKSACIILDYMKETIDIREQFPLLDRTLTQQIANEIGVRHPLYPGTTTPVVMTTDFIITYQRNGQVYKAARTVKPSQELENLRTIEKLAIESEYWYRNGIADYKIVTEKEINTDLVNNIESISRAHNLKEVEGLLSLSDAEREYLYEGFLDELSNWPGTLRALTINFEQKFGLIKGVGMSLLRLAILQEDYQLDLNKPLNYDIATGEL